MRARVRAFARQPSQEWLNIRYILTPHQGQGGGLPHCPRLPLLAFCQGKEFWQQTQSVFPSTGNYTTPTSSSSVCVLLACTPQNWAICRCIQCIKILSGKLWTLRCGLIKYEVQLGSLTNHLTSPIKDMRSLAVTCLQII